MWNAGAGNCGPLAISAALKHMWPALYGDLNDDKVRRAVVAEMRSRPGRYAPRRERARRLRRAQH